MRQFLTAPPITGRTIAMPTPDQNRDFIQALCREATMISQEHAELDRKAALETDPEQKLSLYLKRDNLHADYIALANERVAAMTEL
jgi:hypothetical protein